MCGVALPALVTVMVCAGLVLPCAVVGNVKLPGISVTAGRGATPVPVNGTVCGLPGALSAIASEACRSPAAVGEKTMLIVQVPFDDTTIGTVQFGVAAKSAVFSPVISDEFNLLPSFPEF